MAYKANDLADKISEQLIILVSQHPILFDKNVDHYLSTEVKDNIWRLIAQKRGYGDDGKC